MTSPPAPPPTGPVGAGRPRLRAYRPGRALAAVAIAGLALTAAAGCSTRRVPPAPGLAASGPAATTTLPPTTPAPTTTTTPPATTAAPTTVLTAAPPGPLVVGGWRPIGPLVNGRAALSAALLQAGPGAPATGVVRISASITRPVLYAGSAEPGGTWTSQGAVVPAARPALVAAFNAGFHTWASDGGWFDHGRTAVPLRTGAASLVIRADGSATVGQWGRDVALTADVVSVRQNLGLLVDGGVNLSATASWGVTLHGVRYTWRSGLGVDAAGNLIYAGGPGLDARLLGQVLIQAGAVRAMELDINPQWVSFSSYTVPGVGTDLLAGMWYGPGHWLTGSARDFIAVFTR